MFAMGSANLHKILVGYLLESFFLFTKVGQVDVN
jgi:hypothetical protein